MPGGLTLLAALPADIPTPPANKVTIFFNLTALAPYYKDSSGNLYPLVGNTGSQGIPGMFVMDGEDGADSIIPGPAGINGSAGPAGALGGVQLFTGIDGADGEDSYIPGPPGVAGGAGGGGLTEALLLPYNRKMGWWYYDDLFTGIQHGFTIAFAGGGGGSNVQDAVNTYRRQTTSTAANDIGSFVGSGGGLQGPHFNHLPAVYFNLRTGSAITASQIWAGLFDSTTPATAPGVSATGVLTRKHAAFRFADGTDTQWVGSCADGTTQAVSANIAPIAASTVYKVRMRFITNLSIGFTINGGTEVLLTMPTNASDATDMCIGLYVCNRTGGNTRFIDLAALNYDFI